MMVLAPNSSSQPKKNEIFHEKIICSEKPKMQNKYFSKRLNGETESVWMCISIKHWFTCYYILDMTMFINRSIKDIFWFTINFSCFYLIFLFVVNSNAVTLLVRMSSTVNLFLDVFFLHGCAIMVKFLQEQNEKHQTRCCTGLVHVEPFFLLQYCEILKYYLIGVALHCYEGTSVWC